MDRYERIMFWCAWIGGCIGGMIAILQKMIECCV